MEKTKTQGTIFAIIKWLLIIAVCVFTYRQMFSQHISSASIEDVTEKVIAAADTTTMQEGDNQLIKRIFDLDPTDYDGITYYAPVSNMDVTEVLIVKLKDLSQQQDVSDIMESRISSQIEVFEGYGPDQVAMLEKAVVEVSGNYLMLVVADNPTPVVDAFNKAL